MTANHGRHVVVDPGDGRAVPCRLQGRRLSVVCGDRVRWRPAEAEGAEGWVTAVEPRVSALLRLNARGGTEPVAANLGQLVAVFAPVPAPDAALCDRYLAAAEWAGLRACVVANKSDRPDPDGTLAALLGRCAALGYRTCAASSRSAEGVRELAALLAGEVSVLVGQSGVGKSSLLNRLVPGVEAAVREISAASEEGRHTTSVSSLYRLPGGGDLIDSPGVRDFAPPLPPPREVASGFREIAAAAAGCRFPDCRHLREPDCAVAAAARQGTIEAQRITSYKRLLALAERHASDFRR